MIRKGEGWGDIEIFEENKTQEKCLNINNKKSDWVTINLGSEAPLAPLVPFVHARVRKLK